MKNPHAIERFSKWSAEWKAGRERNDASAILELWHQPVPRAWARAVWTGKLGYRKRSSDKGEQRTEKELFNRVREDFALVFSDQEPSAGYRVKTIYHNMPLANQRKGQVIADAFAVLVTGANSRPLFIEVKVTANNPWFALVENLQQIRLARACARKIENFVLESSKHRVERGVWGLILAPENYYARHSARLSKCTHLLDALKKGTRARVAFGVSDSLAHGQIRIIAHNWLSPIGTPLGSVKNDKMATADV
jgi:hypothetical protein